MRLTGGLQPVNAYDDLVETDPGNRLSVHRIG